MSNDSTDSSLPPRRWFNPRLVVILVVLLAGICVSVILADRFSIRDRNPATRAATVPATAPAVIAPSTTTAAETLPSTTTQGVWP